MKLRKTLSHLFHPQRSNNHRSKLLHHKSLLFLTLIAVGFFQLVHLLASLHLQQGSVLGYASSISIDQVIEETNQERAKLGLVSLKYNEQLSEASLAKAQDMFSNQYWAHISPSGKEPWYFIKQAHYYYKVAGENLARDFDTTATMVDAWMNSPTHRANIVNPRYRDIGVAVVDGHLFGVETTLVVQMFGAVSSTTQVEKSVKVPQIDKKSITVTDRSQVLAEQIVPQGSLSQSILMSPLHLLKAFFLGMIFLLISVLVYDWLVAGHKSSVRLVGKNLAHILLFVFIAYLVVFFKGGVI